MWFFWVHILLYLGPISELIQFASGSVGHFYRYSFYWEYEEIGLKVFDGGKERRFDPARSRLGVLMRGYYEDARIRTKELNYIRFTIEETFQYEVGYIMHEMYDKYKKLVEQFNKGERNLSLDYLRLYKNKKPHVPPERLIYGNDKIERTEVAQKLYFEIFHLSNMIHEITRKWGVSSTDLHPEFGRPKTKKPYFYDDTSYKLYQAKLKREKDRLKKRLDKEKNRILSEKMNDDEMKKKMKFAKSNEQFGLNWEADIDTNNFIKEKMKEQGWEKWHTDRNNGSNYHKPWGWPHDYGWDVPMY